MQPSAGPLEIILSDIERALEARLWYVALAVALSLPDICSLLEQPPDEAWSKRHKYAAWFDNNAGKHFHFLTGDDCYSLRGGVLHHGKFGHPKARYDRIGFTTSDYPVRIHEGLSENNGGIEESMLSLDVEMFCQRLIQAVREWFMANADTPNVQQNLPNVVRLRPQGVAPHFVGMPIIA